ncbi:MAG: hypothetical protein A2Z99_06535 [Treponema sp. GWB1_62_6]|nr:MAG: hypothetical protein A2Y36_13470 [Treponema sp. GWA1_62_8]OHE68058.1 MAG: hypothetical protein A2Z99_06535 [Treponema sp. GWB1_62_6]
MRPAAKRRIPVVSNRLSQADRLGGWKARWDIGRNDYRVEPGLYASGGPDRDSPVLVTANYKLTFDTVRKELAGLDVWLLVLDTKSVNVWCAAGKGTFGTAELIGRIASERLAELVSHRTVVLPQLGASGVAAHEVLAASGFRVVYGPVRAADIPAFLAGGMKKDDRMRRVEFRLRDRMAVAPVELAHALPFLAAAVLASALLAFLPAAGVAGGGGAGGAGGGGGVGGWVSADILSGFWLWTVLLASPVLVGTLLFPALLPWLPFKAFAAKGALLGLCWSAAAALLAGLGAWNGSAFVLVATSLVAFIAMNFTGASTYTNQTGAALEVKIALPAQVAAAAVGLAIAGVRLAGALIQGA